ncbi:hypothetical protein CDAR_177221, partial [Caerostris darwini]
MDGNNCPVKHRNAATPNRKERRSTKFRQNDAKPKTTNDLQRDGRDVNSSILH